MNPVGIALVIIFALIALGTLGYTIYQNTLIAKNKIEVADYKKLLLKELYFGVGSAVSFTLMLGFCYLMFKIDPTPLEAFFALFFGLLTWFSFFTFVNIFILHYYALTVKDNNPEIDKIILRFMLICIPVFILSLLYMTNGFAAHWTYPLPNMLSFSKGFTHSSGNGGAGITFYALCFLGGAIFVYFLVDHIYYKQYGKHGIMESTFLVAFPAGIIAGRLGYVIGNFNVEFASRFAAGEWWSIFAIWEGGLTILSGAIGGIVVGALWFIWRKKQYNIWIAFDIVVPCILLAQAIGRWGNFFNNEVHGLATSASNFSWLPTVIVKNGQFSSAAPTLADGQTYVPLFFIECCINILGYFVLSKLFGKVLRKHTELGDLGFGYIIWYGLTRTFMEPLRYSGFNMGTNGYWSWIWAIIFVLVGSLLIVGNHIIRYAHRKKSQTFKANKASFKKGLISSIILFVVGLTMVIIGAILMCGSSFAASIEFNNFNIGLILVVLGVSLFLGLGISGPILFEGIKLKQNETI